MAEYEDIMEAYQRRLLSSSNQNTPMGEPVLAQKDDAALRRLEELCYDYAPLKDEDGKVVFNKDDEIVYSRILTYPDIYLHLSSVGTLEGTTCYTWESARSMILNWEGTQHDPLLRKYKRDSRAQYILAGIYGLKFRQIHADSYKGFRAEHVENASGGISRIRMQNMNNPQERRSII